MASSSCSPVTIGVAIIGYGLYDIDVFISRALVYGSLAVFITAVYVGIAVGIGTLVGSGGKPNLALSILATAIVAHRLPAGARTRAEGREPARVRKARDTLRGAERVLRSRRGDVRRRRRAAAHGPRARRRAPARSWPTVWLRGIGELRAAATVPVGMRDPVDPWR